MKVVALIPVKLGSERVPKKNIKPFFDGTPLMHFIQKVCLESETIDEAYIYCSDESVKEYMLPGIHFLKRPDFLDLNTANSNTIIKEFMKEVNADIYVETHTTAPFSKSATLDTCVRKVASGEYDSAFCAENVKAFLWQDGKPINFEPDHFPRTQDLPDIYAEADECYVFTKETYETYGRRVGVKPYVHEIDKIEAMGIDWPVDFDMCNALYREMKINENTNK